ncbi:hypothetical protein KC218_24485, partial [Mycobacterium tuberculosis]|nr:hypothetical protein [Mycobacterium tuberculosis]
DLVDAIQRGWFPLKGGRGSSRDLADLLGGTDLDRTWERLSGREPLAAPPAFVGIAAGDTTETRSESAS